MCRTILHRSLREPVYPQYSGALKGDFRFANRHNGHHGIAANIRSDSGTPNAFASTSGNGVAMAVGFARAMRSEERRVGKEWRSGRAAADSKKKRKSMSTRRREESKNET